jgi:ATP-independent RNA helicase DbpA
MTRLQLDAGRRQGIRSQDVVEALTAGAGIAASAIGTIDVYDDVAFVEIEPRPARKALEHAQIIVLRGHEVHLTLARAPHAATDRQRRPNRERREPGSRAT